MLCVNVGGFSLGYGALIGLKQLKALLNDQVCTLDSLYVSHARIETQD